jgi:hypothetical protein
VKREAAAPLEIGKPADGSVLVIMNISLGGVHEHHAGRRAVGANDGEG